MSQHTQQACCSFACGFFCSVFHRLQLLVQLAMLQSSLWLLHCLWPCFCFSLNCGMQYATGTDREEAVYAPRTLSARFVSSAASPCPLLSVRTCLCCCSCCDVALCKVQQAQTQSPEQNTRKSCRILAWLSCPCGCYGMLLLQS